MPVNVVGTVSEDRVRLILLETFPIFIIDITTLLR